nr:hypothetical protein Iba_chr06fCG8290 [Ipomoea batatas]
MKQKGCLLKAGREKSTKIASRKVQDSNWESLSLQISFSHDFCLILLWSTLFRELPELTWVFSLLGANTSGIDCFPVSDGKDDSFEAGLSDEPPDFFSSSFLLMVHQYLLALQPDCNDLMSSTTHQVPGYCCYSLLLECHLVVVPEEVEEQMLLLLVGRMGADILIISHIQDTTETSMISSECPRSFVPISAFLIGSSTFIIDTEGSCPMLFSPDSRF